MQYICISSTGQSIICIRARRAFTTINPYSIEYKCIYSVPRIGLPLDESRVTVHWDTWSAA